MEIQFTYKIQHLSWFSLLFNMHNSQFFSFKLYFTDYAITVFLIALFAPLPTDTPHSLRQSPIIVPVHQSCVHTLASPFPMLYFTSPWLFCNYLFVLLNPLTSSPIPSYPLPLGNHENTLCIHDSVSVLLVCLVCILDSIVNRYAFLPFYCSQF